MLLQRWIKPVKLSAILGATLIFVGGCAGNSPLLIGIDYVPCSQLPGPFLYRDGDQEETMQWGDEYNTIWEVLCIEDPAG
jgi:hypothetical protein